MSYEFLDEANIHNEGYSPDEEEYYEQEELKRMFPNGISEEEQEEIGYGDNED